MSANDEGLDCSRPFLFQGILNGYTMIPGSQPAPLSATSSLPAVTYLLAGARRRIAQAPDEVAIEERLVPERTGQILSDIVGMNGERERSV